MMKNRNIIAMLLAVSKQSDVHESVKGLLQGLDLLDCAIERECRKSAIQDSAIILYSVATGIPVAALRRLHNVTPVEQWYDVSDTVVNLL